MRTVPCTNLTVYQLEVPYEEEAITVQVLLIVSVLLLREAGVASSVPVPRVVRRRTTQGGQTLFACSICTGSLHEYY